MAKTKLLIVTHEMSPFLELTKISEITRQLPQAMQEKGFEIRILMPRFGKISMNVGTGCTKLFVYRG
ncbi:glycogen/starch synthase [Pedobacter sp. NJ-S-72]